MQDNILIKAENVTKSFYIDQKKQKIIENINMSVMDGEFVCVVGPSGGGKSTLLRIIAGLVNADRGIIIKDEKLKLGFVFQNFGLFPWLNVQDNIGFGLKMIGMDACLIKSEVKKQINRIGLTGFENKHPKELSGGMKQRVGIARALAIAPTILLLDEPFSALDTFTAEKLRGDLLNIWRDGKITILMVSHLIEEAVELSDRVIVLSGGPGRVQKEIKINLPRPRQKRDQKFLEYVDQITDLINGR